MDNQSPSMLKATVIGGSLAGGIGAIPVLNLLNCACCALVIGGGFLASFLYSRDCQQAGAAFQPGNGAVVGLVAGMFYALANAVVGRIVSVLLGQSVADAIEQAQEFGGEIPPEAEPFFDFLSSASPTFLMVISFFFVLLLAAVFSTIGGLIGGALFKIDPPAPPAAATPGDPGMSPPPPPTPPAGGSE